MLPAQARWPHRLVQSTSAFLLDVPFPCVLLSFFPVMRTPGCLVLGSGCTERCCTGKRPLRRPTCQGREAGRLGSVKTTKAVSLKQRHPYPSPLTAQAPHLLLVVRAAHAACRAPRHPFCPYVSSLLVGVRVRELPRHSGSLVSPQPMVTALRGHSGMCTARGRGKLELPGALTSPKGDRGDAWPPSQLAL